ncbi:MAG: oxidoreductase C-terminal domain-containing protein [Trebonia sp.]
MRVLLGTTVSRFEGTGSADNGGTIVAAGDCAVTPHPAAAGGSLVRFESFGHAIDHARVAAATLAGVPAPYDAVPWFWSDQGTLKLQIAGLSAGFDQTVLRGDLPAVENECGGRGKPRPFLPIGLSVLSLIGDDRERPGRAGVDRRLDRLGRVAAGVDDHGDRLVVLVEGVRGVPDALPRAHAQVPVDAYLAVARAFRRHCGGHGLSPAR